MSGAIVIAGTRIPIHTVKHYLDAGQSVERIMSEYPDLSRGQIATAALAARYNVADYDFSDSGDALLPESGIPSARVPASRGAVEPESAAHAPADGLADRLREFDSYRGRLSLDELKTLDEACAALSQVRTDARDAEIAKLREERGTYLGTHHDGKWHPSPTGVIVGQLDTELSASRREVAALRGRAKKLVLALTDLTYSVGLIVDRWNAEHPNVPHPETKRIAAARAALAEGTTAPGGGE